MKHDLNNIVKYNGYDWKIVDIDHASEIYYLSNKYGNIALYEWQLSK